MPMTYKLDPDYNCLDRISAWDKETQGVIKERVESELGNEMKFSFLSEEEGKLLERLSDILIIQPKDKNYVKIAEVIDRSLSANKSGVKYGETPWKGELYKKGLAELAKIKNNFAENVNKLLKEKESTEFDPVVFDFISQVRMDSARIFYSHPVSWNQIGFPGPAYPEGYAYLDCNEADTWEPKYDN